MNADVLERDRQLIVIDLRLLLIICVRSCGLSAFHLWLICGLSVAYLRFIWAYLWLNGSCNDNSPFCVRTQRRTISDGCGSVQRARRSAKSTRGVGGHRTDRSGAPGGCRGDAGDWNRSLRRPPAAADT